MGRRRWRGPPPHPAIVAKQHRARVRVALLVLAVAGPFVAWVVGSTVGRPPAAEARPLQQVIADGSGRLTVLWAPQGCERVHPGTSEVVDDDRDVVLVVRAVPVSDASSCDATDAPRRWTFVLDEPLGDRRVFDAGCFAPHRRADDPRCAEGAPEVPVTGRDGDV